MSIYYNPNKVITLLTDFGITDSYVAIMKAVILRINPAAKIVDISHSMSGHNLERTAYTLYSSYRFFPKNSIHIVVIDPCVGSQRRILCMRAAGQYFLAPDNGVLTFIMSHEPSAQVFEIDQKIFLSSRHSYTFHGRDIFAPAAAYISKGKRICSFCKRIESPPVHILDIMPSVSNGGFLKGRVIHVDGFGNLITNIDHTAFTRQRQGAARKDAKKEPIVYIKGHPIYGISRFYAQNRKGELLALWNSASFLEISVNQSSARDLLKAKIGDVVTVLR